LRAISQYEPAVRPCFLNTDQNCFGYRGKVLSLFRDEILLRLIKPERMTASKLLVIPDNAKRLEYELYNGVVLATGPGELRMKDGRRNPITVRVGETVMFYWLAGETRAGNRLTDDDGSELLIVSEKYIMGVTE
jgi:co-chaperonin GroES (HSP10)